MTKIISTLAALFLASSALSTAAQAGGGVRLQFGGPLGSFTAHPHLSSGPGGTARYAQSAKPSYKRHVANPAYAAAARRNALAQQQQRRAQKVEIAQAPLRKPKIAIERPVMPKPVYTAKLQDTAVTTDAAPIINVPRTPELPLTGSQSTPTVVEAPAAAPATATAALQPEQVKPAVSLAPDAEPQAEAAAVTEMPAPAASAIIPVETAPKSVKTETTAATAQTEPAKTEKSDSMASRICRRFSAVIAGLVEVPCE